MKSLFENSKIPKFSVLFAIVFAMIVLACVREDKSISDIISADQSTELRNPFDCGPDPEQDGCTSYPYTNVSVSTFMGCDAVASYSVLVCKTNSAPIKVISIAVYNLDIQFDPTNCSTLVDSIEYYVVHGNQSRANYLHNMFNRLATQNIEALVVSNELGTNQALFLCGEGALVNLDFFSSKCYKFCNVGKKQVDCGIGCCKRSTGYCFEDGEWRKSFPALSQSSPCQSIHNPCEIGNECSASACGMIIPVILDPK